MIKRLVNPAKALRTMRKTPTILERVLQDVSQEQAATLRDGPDGWSILYIVCHLRDLEDGFMARVHTLLNEQPDAVLKGIDIHALAEHNNYAAADLREALATFATRRAQFIAMLETLNDEQWLLAGIHPEQGPATVLDVAINTGLHDIDHIEQIVRCG
jgi:hypothetical protein